MPFTFAHPSVVLPWNKKSRYFDYTGLIIGAMAPDFEYFIHFRPIQFHGHTIWGQVYYNLPLVFIVAIIYHYLIKSEIINNFPNPYCRYYNYISLSRWKLNSVKSLIVFIYSSLLGMFTHVFWDSFTHEGGFFVRQYSIFASNVEILDYSVPIYKIMQHCSTLIGFGIITIFLINISDIGDRSYVDCRSNGSKIFFWSSFVVITLLFFILLVLDNSLMIGEVIVGGISCSLLSITLTCLLNKLLHSGFIGKRSKDV